MNLELLANIAFIATALALFVLLHRVNEPAALAIAWLLIFSARPPSSGRAGLQA